MRNIGLTLDMYSSFASLLFLEITTEWLKLVEEAQFSNLGWDLPAREEPCRGFQCCFLFPVFKEGEGYGRGDVNEVGWKCDLVYVGVCDWHAKLVVERWRHNIRYYSVDFPFTITPLVTHNLSISTARPCGLQLLIADEKHSTYFNQERVNVYYCSLHSYIFSASDILPTTYRLHITLTIPILSADNHRVSSVSLTGFLCLCKTSGARRVSFCG